MRGFLSLPKTLAYPIYFAKGKTHICLSISLLYIPLKTSDPVLNCVLEQQALQTLEQLPQQNNIVEQVNLLIIDTLRLQCANIDWVAQKLHVSNRQLQKLLKSQK